MCTANTPSSSARWSFSSSPQEQRVQHVLNTMPRFFSTCMCMKLHLNLRVHSGRCLSVSRAVWQKSEPCPLRSVSLSLWAADLYLLLKICSTSSLKWLFWLLHIYIHRIPADQVVLFNRFCCTQVIISTVHCWVYWWQKMWKMLITFSQSSQWRPQTASCCPNNGPNRQNSSFTS